MVMVAVAVSSSSIHAQEKNNAGQVVLLDVAKVFRVNAEFEKAMSDIKAEAETLKRQIEAKQNDIRRRAADVAQFKVGTVERNQEEARLEQEQTALRTEARQQETDLLKREAQIYYNTYQKMQGVVSGFAQQNGISLVLRFDSGDIDPANRNEVINGVNRAVVFHHYRDITKYIIDQMGPRTQKAMAEMQKDTTQK